MPLVGVENDYLPDVLSQEMGQLEFEGYHAARGRHYHALICLVTKGPGLFDQQQQPASGLYSLQV